MAEINYQDSDYRFRSPVRYFTANDPYYWEVDNIPLQQLMENDLWLRDQLSKVSLAGVTRSDFVELKPYVDGTDNKVKVMPGRFTARINDISTSLRFQAIQRIAGEMFSEVPAWQVATYNTPAVKGNIDKITSEAQDDVTFMNGLIERSFTYPAVDPYNAFIDYRTGTVNWNPHLPLRDVAFFGNTNVTIPGTQSLLWTSNWVDYRPGVGFAAEGQLQNRFMQFWRGVARTSIVDVPEELEIEIPAFNIRDFDFIDETGQRQQRNNAEVRIDLVFIYSRPIDSLETRVLDPRNPSGRRIITRAELGIIKGAGAILKKGPGSRSNSTDDGGFDEAGNPQILASVADQKATVGGFAASGVYGSFPSPDDLINISPLLAEDLESNDPFLLGQTALPVAYVVVRNNAQVNQAGVQILTDSSLIDIRPFFRTTELSYNERAGIAAAVPAISVANPVVSKLELRYETKRLYDDYISRIGANTGGNNQDPTNHPRMVGGGYILGGSLYGPEAAIQHQYLNQTPTLTLAQLNQQLIARHGYRSDVVIPETPDWDLARWAGNQSLVTDPGTKRNDWVNSYHRGDLQTGTGTPAGVAIRSQNNDFGIYTNSDRLDRLLQVGSDAFDGKLDVYFVTKTIRINRDNVPWLDDFFVNVGFLNCFPMSSRYNSNDDRVYPGASDIWVSKTRSSFTIYVAWVAHQVKANTSIDGIEAPIRVRDTKNLNGFGVMTKEMYNVRGNLGALTSPSEPAMGICTYPSVTFQIVGMPSNYQGMPSSLAGNEPVIRLT